MNFKIVNMNTNNINVMRIYFGYGQTVKGQSLWQRLWSNNLGQLLLKKAKEMNIEQANIFIAKAGYLDNDKISFNISEIPSKKNPVCLELVDTAEKLKNFIGQNRKELNETNVILLNNECFKIDQ